MGCILNISATCQLDALLYIFQLIHYSLISNVHENGYISSYTIPSHDVTYSGIQCTNMIIYAL